MIEPLLKWPGGKRVLLPHLLTLIPTSFNRYFEPFFGGGALFFAIQPYPARLSDSNPELISCYQAIRDNPWAILSHLARMKNSKSFYLRARSMSPRSKAAKAARLIYLATLSFNGIYRVNQKGQFNVPYGWKKHLRVAQKESIIAVSKALANRSIKCLDFEDAVKDAAAHDLVYLDPPYTVAHGHNGFLKYNSRIFSWDDQIRLARTARMLDARGCYVLISNASHCSIQNLYKRFTQIAVNRPSRIAASAAHRRIVKELIITNQR